MGKGQRLHLSNSRRAFVVCIYRSVSSSFRPGIAGLLHCSSCSLLLLQGRPSIAPCVPQINICMLHDADDLAERSQQSGPFAMTFAGRKLSGQVPQLPATLCSVGWSRQPCWPSCIGVREVPYIEALSGPILINSSVHLRNYLKHIPKAISYV